MGIKGITHPHTISKDNYSHFFNQSLRHRNQMSIRLGYHDFDSIIIKV